MITVETRTPSSLKILKVSGSQCTIGSSSHDGWTFPVYRLNGNTYEYFAVLAEKITRRVDHIDVGSIVTNESALSGCNDCWHYDVEGSLTRDKTVDIPHGSYNSHGGCNVSYVTPSGTMTRTCILPEFAGIWESPKYSGAYGSYQIRNKKFYYTYSACSKAWLTSGDELITIHAHVDHWASTAQWSDTHDWEWSEEVTKTFKISDLTEEASQALPDPTEILPPTAPSIYYVLRPDNPIFNYVELMIRDEGGEWGDLTLDAAQRVRLTNSNTWLNLFELMDLPNLASGLSKLAAREAYTSVKTLVKAASDTYLAYHYGLRLTVNDMKSFCDKVDKIDFDYYTQTAGSEREFTVDLPGRPGTQIHIARRAKLVLDAATREQYTILENMKKLSRKFYELDLTPSISNVWDAIPFSFVLDWFFPIGDAFDRAEGINYVKTLHFRRCFYSEKWNWFYHDDFVTDSGYHYFGDLSFRFYNRTCRPSCIVPSQNVDHSPIQDAPKHWLEATALFLSLRG